MRVNIDSPCGELPARSSPRFARGRIPTAIRPREARAKNQAVNIDTPLRGGELPPGLDLNSDDLHMQTQTEGIVKYIVIVVVALLIGIFFGINDEAFSLKGMAASSFVGGIAAVAILYIFSLKKGRDRTR